MLPNSRAHGRKRTRPPLKSPILSLSCPPAQMRRNRCWHSVVGIGGSRTAYTMCAMSPLWKIVLASALVMPLSFLLPVVTWPLPLFTALALLTLLLRVAPFRIILALLLTCCLPGPLPSNNSQALVLLQSHLEDLLCFCYNRGMKVLFVAGYGPICF